MPYEDLMSFPPNHQWATEVVRRVTSDQRHTEIADEFIGMISDLDFQLRNRDLDALRATRAVARRDDVFHNFSIFCIRAIRELETSFEAMFRFSPPDSSECSMFRKKLSAQLKEVIREARKGNYLL